MKNPVTMTVKDLLCVLANFHEAEDGEQEEYFIKIVKEIDGRTVTVAQYLNKSGCYQSCRLLGSTVSYVDKTNYAWIIHI